MKNIMWFRSDLRVIDNTALIKAQKDADVIGLFLFSPNDWKRHNEAPAKLDFIWQNLVELQSRLGEFNIPLLIREVESWGQVPSEITNIVKDYDVTGVYWNQEVGLNELRRDEAVAKQLNAQAISSYALTDRTIYPLGSLLNQSGQPYKVFTPFKNVFLQRISENVYSYQGKIKKQNKLEILSDPIPTNSYQSSRQNTFKIGEEAAFVELANFLDMKVYDYKNNRDIPSIEGTSRISAYLTSGTLSIRTCFYEAYLRIEEDSKNSEGIRCWIDELIWREFYANILHCFPRLSMGYAFQEKTENILWREDANDLLSWQTGTTGIPIVDAFMRQLKNTGWMHNRGRMITAMFLSKNLLIDWREGEKWFMTHLIDGDFAANNGGWQWSASTGTDAVPYFRIFNPVLQSQKIDPDGVFIKTWCPELAHLDRKQIHQPLKTAIVDLKTSRIRAIDAFKSLQ